MTRTKLKIEGMTCGHCAGAVGRGLRAVEGVTVESVGPGSAVVEYDPARVSPERLEEAVAAAGYLVRGMEPAG